jgi:branched-chain amino acid transport system permease protein
VYRLSQYLTDGFSRRFSRTVREDYRQDEAYASTPQGRFWLAIAIVSLLLLPLVLPAYPLFVATQILVAALAGLGLHLLVGGAGQISLGQAAFVGVGAYVSSHLTGDLAPLGILMGGVVAALIGMFLGISSLRIKGAYLAIGTLAFQFLADYVFRRWIEFTGGVAGRKLPPEDTFLGLPLTDDRVIFYMGLAFAIPLFFYAKRLLSTRAGRGWFAVRDNDLSAQLSGVDLMRSKLTAFALSAFYAGIAGGILIHLIGVVTPENFVLFFSIQYLALVIVGGAGTVLGAVFGAFFIVLIPEVLSVMAAAFGPQYVAQLSAWRAVVFGSLILMFLILEPRGLVGLWGKVRDYFRTWPLPY